MKLNENVQLTKELKTRNRMGIPAMDTLAAEDGMANEFHIQHYGARSYGGYGLIIVESTAISSPGKIRSKDLGLWKDEQIEPMSRVSKVIKMGGALAGIQLNHSGGKAEMDEKGRITATKKYDHLDLDKMRLITKNDLKDLEEDFVSGAKRAKEAGFDFVELHGAHGYIINQIINPFLNDAFEENDILERSKFLINIVKRIKEDVKIPVGIRLSISDHLEEKGMQPNDYKPLIKELEPYLSFINISSGETLSKLRSEDLIKVAGTKLFRIPLIKEVRSFTNLTLISAGNISTPEDVEEVIEAGADIALMGRESLFNPNFPVNTALNEDDLDEEVYHWNKNIWFSPQRYLSLMKMLKLK